MDRTTLAQIEKITVQEKIYVLNSAIKYVKNSTNKEQDYCTNSMCMAIHAGMCYNNNLFSLNLGYSEYCYLFPEFTQRNYVRKYWYVPSVVIKYFRKALYWDDLNYKSGIRRIKFLTEILNKYEAERCKH